MIMTLKNIDILNFIKNPAPFRKLEVFSDVFLCFSQKKFFIVTVLSGLVLTPEQVTGELHAPVKL